MTAVLQHSRVTAVPPSPRPDAELLTVTARPIVSGAVVLVVRGEVDLVTGPPLKIRLLEHVRPTGPPLVIDLSDVIFLGAAGLTVLVTVREAAMAAGVVLCLVGRTRPVLLPLHITGLDGVFDICPDIAHALLRLGCGPDG